MLNILEASTYKVAYNQYVKIPNNIDSSIIKLKEYIDKLNNYKEYVKNFTNNPNTTLRDKAKSLYSSITSYINILNTKLKELENLRKDVSSHIDYIDKSVVMKNLYNLGAGYLKFLTPYVSSIIEKELQKIKNNLNIYIKLTNFNETIKFIKNTENNYQDILKLSQDKGLISITSKVGNVYSEWKNYLKYGIIIAGVGVAGFYLKPFIDVFGSRLKKKE